jgi:putative transposase
MYACGMSVREIQRRLQEIYGIDVSPDLVCTITDAVLEQIGEWQDRPLPVYAIVFCDCLRVARRAARLHAREASVCAASHRHIR